MFYVFLSLFRESPAPCVSGPGGRFFMFYVLFLYRRSKKHILIVYGLCPFFFRLGPQMCGGCSGTSQGRDTAPARVALSELKVPHVQPSILRFSCWETWRLHSNEEPSSVLGLLSEGRQDPSNFWRCRSMFTEVTSFESNLCCERYSCWIFTGADVGETPWILLAVPTESGDFYRTYYKARSCEVTSSAYTPPFVHREGYWDSDARRLVQWEFTLEEETTFQKTTTLCGLTSELSKNLVRYEVGDGIENLVSTYVRGLVWWV